MKTVSLLTLAMSLAWTQAQQSGPGPEALTTQTLTMLDNSGSTLTATVTLVNTEQQEQQRPSATPTPTTTASPSSADTDEEPSITSLIQATRTESRYIPSASGTTTLNSDGIDVEGGASGSSSGGFSLSKGGMIAVIVVVVCVAVFGVLSITLFILAKKRQWRVRESIKRASRRLTGRNPGPAASRDQRKRSGVIAGAGRRAPPGTPLVEKKERKRGGEVVSETEMRDLEKGEGGAGAGKKGREAWLRKMRGNDWR